MAFPPNAGVSYAAALLRSGGIVAFPTETVYGLGADATCATAVGRVFAAKGRPATNPLIVHVADAGLARRWTTAWPEAAERLAKAFWPGPLTMILPAAPELAPGVLAGGTTVGVRVPAHPLAIALLAECCLPIAAPSANRSNELSPTTADAVRESLGGAVDYVLDGGPCRVGIESTVVDLTTDPVRVLRPGMISATMLSQVLECEVLVATGRGAEAEGQRAPGQFVRHYAPKLPLELVSEGELIDASDAFRIRIGGRLTLCPMDGLMELPDDPDLVAARLYASLREGEKSGYRRILVSHPPEHPDWMGILDRLRRAAAPG